MFISNKFFKKSISVVVTHLHFQTGDDAPFCIDCNDYFTVKQFSIYEYNLVQTIK
jgi:hypothetical protein